jgi:hypothetical protein
MPTTTIDESKLDDRSLLVLINERLRVQGDTIASLLKEHTSLAQRVTVLETAAATQRGFLGGLRAVWVFVLSLPAGVVAGWWGSHQVQ